MIDVAGECLLSNSHVIYAGADAAGILTMVDASECVATFGSGIFRLLPFINTQLGSTAFENRLSKI